MACRCAPSLVALRNEVNARWPERDKASDGCCGDAAHAARKSDHNPDLSGYAHAYDFDEDLFSGAGDRPLWDTLRPILLADPRTKYVIYEARIMYPDGTNKPYTGINAHAHHLHLSIRSTATLDTRRWLPTLPPTSHPKEDADMFESRVVTIPPPRADGAQVVWQDVNGKPLGVFRHDVTATLKANDDGRPVRADVQVCAYGEALLLSFVSLDGGPVGQGNVEVILGHPAR